MLESGTVLGFDLFRIFYFKSKNHQNKNVKQKQPFCDKINAEQYFFRTGHAEKEEHLTKK